jgi:hypothetical protein
LQFIDRLREEVALRLINPICAYPEEVRTALEGQVDTEK